jgi:hypothetical protein
MAAEVQDLLGEGAFQPSLLPMTCVFSNRR